MKLLIGIAFGLLYILVVAIVFALPILWLWNDVMPDLFKPPEITLRQAVCLSLLCSLLFKSSGSSSKND